MPEVRVQLSPVDPFIPPDQWTWKLSDPNGVKSDLSFKGYAQASCPDALTFLQVRARAGR